MGLRFRHGRLSALNLDEIAAGDRSQQEVARFKTTRTQVAGMHNGDALAQVALFQGCSQDFVGLVAEQVENKVYAAGDVILKQGDFGDSMYLLHRGEVEVIVSNTLVATLGGGSVFGEVAAICKDLAASRRSATVVARGFVDCRVLKRDALMLILAHFPRERKLLEAERDRRLQDLGKKGLLPQESGRACTSRRTILVRDESEQRNICPIRRQTIVQEEMFRAQRAQGQVSALRAQAFSEGTSSSSRGSAPWDAAVLPPCGTPVSARIAAAARATPVLPKALALPPRLSTEALLAFSGNIGSWPGSDSTPRVRSGISSASTSPSGASTSPSGLSNFSLDSLNSAVSQQEPAELLQDDLKDAAFACRPPARPGAGDARPPAYPAPHSAVPLSARSASLPSRCRAGPFASEATRPPRPRQLQPLGPSAAAAARHREALAVAGAKRVCCMPGEVDVEHLARSTGVQSQRQLEAEILRRALGEKEHLCMSPGKPFLP